MGPCNASPSCVTVKCQPIPHSRAAFSHKESGTPHKMNHGTFFLHSKSESWSIRAVEELTWVEKGDWRNTMPFLGISIR